MKKFVKFLVFLLLAGTLCGCSEEEEQKEIVIRSYDADAYKAEDFVLENNYLKFELDPATTHIKITDKSNGKVWLSNPVDADTDPIASVAGKKILQSTLMIKYSTENDQQPIFNNYELSISNGIYDLEKRGNEVRVNYTIGKVARKFLIPPAVPDERMHEFFDKMERSDQKKVENWYRCYNIDRLLATDDKDELLEKYPDLTEHQVWDVRPATKDYQKEQMEKMFASVGYTEEDYEKDLLYYSASDSNDKPMFNITMIYRLEGDRFVVEVPHELIEYKNEYPLVNISILPFFGCGTSTDTGFLLVPEGSGAVINFNNGKIAQSSYIAQLYGWDYGLKRDVVVDETRAAFPVFGISNGDGSFVSIIDDYSSLASIKADVAGKEYNYNYAYFSYDMIHTSKMDISAKSQSTILEFEKKLPEGSTRQSYYFSDSNSYVDMAKIYRDYLTTKYPELQEVTKSELPVNVEFIAAIDRIKQVLGFPVNGSDVLTSFKQAKSILEEMTGTGYENLSVRYTGWMNGGVNHSIPKDIDLTSGMGGKSALKDLISYANDNHIDLYLSGKVSFAYDSNIFDGFLRNRDTAKYISRELSDIPTYSNIFFSGLDDARIKHHYLLRPSVSVDLIQNLASYAKKLNVGVGFEEIGRDLSGDYNQRREVTREQVMKTQMEELAKIKASGQQILASTGNDYILPYATLITDVDLRGKEYILFDNTVPFYEIAIHGLVNYTGKSINLYGDALEAVLECAEAGAGLSFTFFAEDAEVLQNTEYMDYFGASYESWKELANKYYSRYKKEMSGLNNQEIVNHQVIEKGVTATIYEDGTVVYVNKNNVPYSSDFVTINAKDYKVERSGN